MPLTNKISLCKLHKIDFIGRRLGSDSWAAWKSGISKSILRDIPTKPSYPIFKFPPSPSGHHVIQQWLYAHFVYECTIINSLYAYIILFLFQSVSFFFLFYSFFTKSYDEQHIVGYFKKIWTWSSRTTGPLIVFFTLTNASIVLQ